jgi:hypothetical protein
MRRVGRHVENLHSNIKDFSSQSRRTVDSTRKKILPDQYSFWHSERNQDRYRIIHRHKMNRRMHHIRRAHHNFKDFMQSVKSGLDSTRKKIIPNQYSFWHSERGSEVHKMVHGVKRFHVNHKNMIILATSILVAFFLLKSGILDSIVPSIAKFGYFSIFILGILLPLGFTTAPVAATLYSISPHFNPLLMSLTAALGAMLGNILIYFFVKYELTEEIKYIFTNDLKLDFYKFELTLTKKNLKSKYFRILVPPLSGILIALPIPTEMFVSILWNITKVELKYVLLLSFIFSFVGILGLVYLHI